MGRRKLIRAEPAPKKIWRTVTMEDIEHSDGKMYDHNKLLSLYQTDVQEARLYLDKHIGYFLDRVSWKIHQNELDEMRTFATAIIDEFAQRQIAKYEGGSIEGKSADSNKIGRYLVITLRGRLMNVAIANQKWNDVYDPTAPEDLDIELEEKDEMSIDATYNIISDAILSLGLSEQQVIGIHMSMIGRSSDAVCALELGMEVKEFKDMMKEVKHLIQQYIYDNTNTCSTHRGL